MLEFWSTRRARTTPALATAAPQSLPQRQRSPCCRCPHGHGATTSGTSPASAPGSRPACRSSPSYRRPSRPDASRAVRCHRCQSTRSSTPACRVPGEPTSRARRSTAPTTSPGAPDRALVQGAGVHRRRPADHRRPENHRPTSTSCSASRRRRCPLRTALASAESAPSTSSADEVLDNPFVGTLTAAVETARRRPGPAAGARRARPSSRGHRPHRRRPRLQAPWWSALLLVAAASSPTPSRRATASLSNSAPRWRPGPGSAPSPGHRRKPLVAADRSLLAVAARVAPLTRPVELGEDVGPDIVEGVAQVGQSEVATKRLAGTEPEVTCWQATPAP